MGEAGESQWREGSKRWTRPLQRIPQQPVQRYLHQYVMFINLRSERKFNQFVLAMMRFSHGSYTEKEIERSSKMCGDFGKDLDKIMDGILRGVSDDDGDQEERRRRYNHRANTEKLNRDVGQFVHVYRDRDFFGYDPSRGDVRIPTVPDTEKIKTPFKLGKFLYEQSKQMDKWITLAEETATRVRETE